MFEHAATSAVVLGVLWALIAFSVVTWTLIFVKTFQIWRMRRQNNRFRESFWSANDLQVAASRATPVRCSEWRRSVSMRCARSTMRC
jgi:biopolymer transport protein ExbB/TolQ